jgi:hypothetical protein
MSGPLDVLAVLDQAAAALKYAGARREGVGRVIEARAAVAELVEADRALDAADAAYGRAKTGAPRNVAWDAVLAARKRRAEALAKFGEG